MIIRPRIRTVLAGLASAAALAVSWPARAQMPTVEPDGSLAEPAAPPPAQRAAPGPVGPQQGQPAPAPDSKNVGAGSGYYHSDAGEGPLSDQESEGAAPAAPGVVPAVHVVRAGDTLWDICWSYFNNAWEWPRVWSYNPEITNPHWIYPGDKVRLRPPGPEAPASGGPSQQAQAPAAAAAPAPLEPHRAEIFELRQLAFVASEDLALGMAIDGSPEEKIMLASGDEVYLSFPPGRPPRVGQRYAVYLEEQRVRHPTRDEEVGAYVRVVGEVEVIGAAAGKRARGVLLDSVDVIERGMSVGPLARQFRSVEPVPAEVDLEATIVADLGAEELIGDRQLVFIDRGSQDRLRAGNRMHVIRRGDAYETVMGPTGSIGKNDARYPARSIGEVLVLQTGTRSSVAVVIRAEKELGVGDRVLMNRAHNRQR